MSALSNFRFAHSTLVERVRLALDNAETQMNSGNIQAIKDQCLRLLSAMETVNFYIKSEDYW